MRIALLLSFAFLTSVTSAEITPGIISAVAPCTTATNDCTGWVVFGAGPARTMVYTSYSLDTRNDGIRRALIMVHGTNRNADHYFQTALAAAFLAGALNDTIVIAPHLVIATDPRQADEVDWPAGGDSWRSGGMSASHPELSAFDVVDELLRKLANKRTFPNMNSIVVTGHSAGGQFATRYAMANKVHDTLGVPITYVVANPSSYAWPDAVRPLKQGDADAAAAKDGWNTKQDNQIHVDFTYGPYDAAAERCANYNRWPLGLENRTGYTAKMSDDQLRKQLVSRPTTFLVGQVDTLPLGGFDSSCSAMAQGPTRRSRGEAFVKFVNEKMGAKHAIQVVPECGHNDRCIFTTDVVLPIIFPKY
jgi:pimeloyl-ACP methyl ester carboxylesterase